MTAERAPSWTSHWSVFAREVLVWPAAGLALTVVMWAVYQDTTFDFFWASVVMLSFGIAGWKTVIPLGLRGYMTSRLALMLLLAAVVADFVGAVMGGSPVALSQENLLGLLVLIASASLGMVAGALRLVIRSKP